VREKLKNHRAGLVSILVLPIIFLPLRLVAENGWSVLPNLPTAEAAAASTRLHDGRVFVAGGGFSPTLNYLGSQIFDPVSKSWQVGPDLDGVRVEATASILPNGDVLIAGGDGENGRLATTVICHPSATLCEPTGRMAFARSRHTAVTLQDGRILIVGGSSGTDVPAASVSEIYDPLSAAWQTTSPLNVPRTEESVTLLDDGRVMVSGGFTAEASPQYSASVEIYDPVEDTWTLAAPMSSARCDHSSTLLSGGRVLVVGGVEAVQTTLATAAIYDPTSDRWTDAAPLDEGRFGQTANVLPDGRVLLVGGTRADLTLADDTPIYLPALDTWDMHHRLPPGRRYQAAVSLQDGRVIIAGGLLPPATPLVALFDGDVIFSDDFDTPE
jgi:large repetitive protein